MEWALLELRALFPKKQYEEIVVGTCVALSEETSADFIAMMNSISAKNRATGPGTKSGDGTRGGLGMHFEPHLPDTSCTVRMWWKPQVE